ncbi:uncharacterized protein ACIBXB_021857 [Morphnus guianensis]
MAVILSMSLDWSERKLLALLQMLERCTWTKSSGWFGKKNNSEQSKTILNGNWPNKFPGEDKGLTHTHIELAPVPKSSPLTQLGPQGCCAPIGSQGCCWLLPLPFWILFCRWKYCKADVSIPLRAHPHACMDACTHTHAHTHAQSFAGAGLVLPKGPEEEATGALPRGAGVAEPCGRFGQSSPIGWGQRLSRAPNFKLPGAADGWAVLREGINHQMCETAHYQPG